MKKIITILIFAILAIGCAFAQNTKTKSTPDELSLVTQQEMLSEYGIPTVEAVDKMWESAGELYDSQNWEQAITAYEQFSKQANWLANLLSQCLKPYYSASYDEKKNVNYATIKTFLPYEKASNNYKRLRNTAFIRMGLCYKNLNDNKNALAYLHKGLSLLDMDSIDDWLTASMALSELVGFKPSANK